MSKKVYFQAKNPSNLTKNPYNPYILGTLHDLWGRNIMFGAVEMIFQENIFPRLAWHSKKVIAKDPLNPTKFRQLKWAYLVYKWE